MYLIECSRSYADQILAIYNDAILTTTAMYEYSERPKESMTACWPLEPMDRFGRDLPITTPLNTRCMCTRTIGVKASGL